MPNRLRFLKLALFKRAYQVWTERGMLGFLKFSARALQKRAAHFRRDRDWIKRHTFTAAEALIARKTLETWSLQPKFSVVMPVYNVEPKWLKKAIESVRQQVYPHWELCIADDASTEPSIKPLLEAYMRQDSRIRVVFRAENGNISEATNSAIAIAAGDYIALLDNDDELTPDALYENAKLIHQHPDADFIYSDEDKISETGRRSGPFFKPDWSPEYFQACMYTCHLGVYRTELVRAIGGFRKEYDGSQDYDLVLRLIEKTQNIYHIPKILYHWRSLPSSVASEESAKPWAYDAARRALEAMLARSPYPGSVTPGISPGFWRIHRTLVQKPLISIIIPSAGTERMTPKGKLCLLENCIKSIHRETTYAPYEIVVIDGHDLSAETVSRLQNWNVKLVRSQDPFNFSSRINQAVEQASGEVLVLLNDDTEVLTPDWLEVMLELARQEEIGAVGAKLLYPDEHIQHAGVLILDGNPTHAFHRAEADHPGYFFSNEVHRNFIAVTGACLMVRRSRFLEAGGLSSDFPLNYNDVDFCLRLHQLGYRNVYVPYARLIHYESASREDGLQPGEWENLNGLWQDYWEKLGGDPYYNPNLSTQSPDFQIKL